MVVSKSLKIFVEPDEEIVFILQKIMNSPSNRVILIVPNTAVLISSGLSLKLLAKQLIDTPKLIVLVCDNDGVNSLGEKAGLIITKKVSEVNNDMWAKAKGLQDLILSDLLRTKNELLGDRQEPVSFENVIEPSVEMPVEKIVSGEPKPVKASIIEEAEVVIPVVATKPRLKGRVIDVGKLKIYSGGDILENQELVRLERDRNNPEKVVTLSGSEEITDKMQTRSSGLLGQDVAEQLSSSNDSLSKRSRKPSKLLEKIKVIFTNLFKVISLKKFVLGFLVAFALFFLVSYFFLTSVDISIELTENSLLAKKTISAKTDITEIDVANLVVPAVRITKEDTLSSEAVTTGIGYTGEYAQGSVSLINTSNKPVTIKAGTNVTYQKDPNLVYKTLEDVTIDALKSDTKIIKAVNFGEEYNIKTTLEDFTLAGFADVAVSNITQLTGGTKSEIKIVSKEDIEVLKASMIEELKNRLLLNIKNPLTDDDVLLAGSEKFTETSFSTSLNENQEGESFTADLKMSLSAIKVTKTEIKSLLEEVVKAENSVAKAEIAEPVIENIVITDTLTTFDVKANASTANDIDIESLKEEIKGKGVNEVKEYIKNITGVEDVVIRYTPAYIPQTMQKIPDDISKISITKSSPLE